ncbi:MAG: L-methionine (R)-S-oxide reductase [Thermotogaceae bacterium]|nr:L-methionine (R)-S-oxide reductase [Thermotogaceae bacterium]MDN5337102.1 L-methionine (R)-S-oxide reductase [Thermotogaceae bacterium]
MERSEHFFEILRYDKLEWLDFWKEYRTKKFPVVVPLYEKRHGLTSDEKILEALNRLTRPFLDRLYQKLKCDFPQLKQEAVKEISKRQTELELSKERFHMMIIGLLGLEPYTIVQTPSRGIVVLLDPVGIEKKAGLDNFIDFVLEAAFKAKELSNSMNQ